MKYRITGFTDGGEVRIADDRNRLVAYGELRVVVDDGWLMPGDVRDLDVRITWVAEDCELDWDGFLRELGP